MRVPTRKTIAQIPSYKPQLLRYNQDVRLYICVHLPKHSNHTHPPTIQAGRNNKKPVPDSISNDNEYDSLIPA
jgi:hypothetical protein